MIDVSSTTLGYSSRHCAAAALRQLRCETGDRSVYSVGTAAHAALEAAARKPRDGESKLQLPRMRAAVASLMRGERTFKGQAEPPYPIEQSMEGLRLAEAWVSEVGVPRGEVEIGIAVDREWRLVDYREPHHYGQVLDVVRRYRDVDDEGREISVIGITDYKTQYVRVSTALGQVDTLQMRGALALGAALAEHEDAEAVEIQVGAVRQRRHFPREPRRIFPNHPVDGDDLSRWRAEIDLAAEAIGAIREKDPDSVASPGLGCMGCPYFGRCKPASDAMGAYGTAIMGGDPAAAASAYFNMRAAAGDAETHLQAYVRHCGSITLDGKELAFHPQERADLVPDFVAILAEALGWTPREESLFMSIKPGVGAVRSLLRAQYRREGANTEKLDELWRAVFTTKIVPVWGVRPVETVEQNGGAEVYPLAPLVEEAGDG